MNRKIMPLVLMAAAALASSDVQAQHPLQNAAITPRGAIVSYMRAAEPLSVGHVVQSHPVVRFGVVKGPVSSQAVFGVVYSDASGSTSVASGAWCWIAHSGLAQVIMDAAATQGTLITTSATTAGEAQEQPVVPPVTVAEHNGEIGHLVSNATTAHSLAWAILHWN